jgi:hypothetical protein
MRSGKIYLSEKRNSRNPWKLANELCNLRSLRTAAACYGNDNCMSTMCFEIMHRVVQRISMKCGVETFPSSINPRSLWWK